MRNDVNEMIKQAYAYGASVALQEVGYDANQAQQAAAQLTHEKTAEEGEEEGGGMSPALMALLGGGAGAVLGAGGGALAGKLTGSNLLRRAASGVAGTPTNPMTSVPNIGAGLKQQALLAGGQLSRGEQAKNRLFDILANSGQQGSLLAPRGAMGQLGGSAALGAAGGGALGAGAGGLYGGLSE